MELAKWESWPQTETGPVTKRVIETKEAGSWKKCEEGPVKCTLPCPLREWGLKENSRARGCFPGEKRAQVAELWVEKDLGEA